MKECRFFVVTDTHYFAKSLDAFGAVYEDRMDNEQKCFAETESINRAVFDLLAKRDEADIVLIAGDLSYDGEKESHREFSRLLREFQEKSGKKVFVVTAGHDCNATPHAYNDEGRHEIEGTAFDELYDYYRDFGYDRAIVFDRARMSYVAELSEDVRLLVICNDTAEARHVTYTEDFLGWIAAQARKAQADGKMMIAMEHYPVLPGQPVFALIRDAYQKENDKLVETLADNGVHLIFTGHMHNQSINAARTAKGNVLYDVCTGCTIGHPAYIRLVTIRDSRTVEVQSFPVPEFDWDKKGLTGEAYLRAQFEKMIRTLLECMRNDPERFMRKLHIKDSSALQKMIRFFGGKLAAMTLGKLARLLCIRIDPSIRGESFIDTMIDVVRSVFEGNQPFVEGTPKGDLLLRVFRRVKPFVRHLKDAEGNPIDFYETMKHTIGNYGIDDYNAVLHF